MNIASLERQKSLVQWVSQATGINAFGVKVQLRGNDLHILCEGPECPQQWRTLSDLLQALQQTDLQLLTGEQPSIYQVFVYGRKKGEQRPEWCHRVYLNQLDKHLEEVRQALLADGEQSPAPGGSLIVSNESLARQGNLDAIARYLSETLSTFGVAVQVTVKPQQPIDNSQGGSNRLWIFCQSAYSPDPSLVGEPIAQKLRHLKLSNYQDAVIVCQVSGETKPDWQMRVDLTPPEVMLKEWARWGDVQAIARLLTEGFSQLNVAVSASVQESTIHIFCHPAVDPLETAPAPDKTLCLEAILPQLEAIAPQGILAATVYGQKTADKQPAWVDWLALPAKEHPNLASSPLELATTGDHPAINFLLERLLNPDLEWRLKTGGIRVLLLRKGDLLHVMCDAPVCPAIKPVAAKVTQFIRQLKIPDLLGVRVYGRRAGNKEPFWHHGEDFQPRQHLVPEATPEFAATSAYVNQLLTSETNEAILRPDLTTDDVQTLIKEVARDSVTTAITKAKNFLLVTQIFTEIELSAQSIPDAQGLKVALVWGCLGLLLTMQTDWALGLIISHTQEQQPKVARVHTSPPVKPQPSLKPQANLSPRSAFLATRSGRKSSSRESSIFNSSSFTQSDDSNPKNLKASPLKDKADAKAILSALPSPIPSFNTKQLDQQIALYKQRLAKTGHPPHVLIIGSSRALRGIDPAPISNALATQGYENIDVFNLGINGATAQVVNFVIRWVLEPSELPKIILWADGSRAFNSGREDVTFNAIASSPGYKQVLQKARATGTDEDLRQNSPSKSETEKTKDYNQGISSYESVNEWLNQALGNVSVSYEKREQIKALLLTQINSLPFLKEPSLPTSSQKKLGRNDLEIDVDGFLPLSMRFHPPKYYQQYRKVPGIYDTDYQFFKIEGQQDAAFQDLLKFTQSRNITLVFVNMPLTAEYLDTVRKQYEQQFQIYMSGLSASPDFIYRDFSQLWPNVNDYFSDPSHLNRFGAYQVSQKLARDQIIFSPIRHR